MKNTKPTRKKPSLGVVGKTERGFPVIYFPDYYHNPCRLQASSLALYQKPGTSAVWLGVRDAKPVVMATDAEKVGVKTEETMGWVPYPIPPEVLLHTEMHLDRRQVEALIGHLQNWLDTDTF